MTTRNLRLLLTAVLFLPVLFMVSCNDDDDPVAIAIEVSPLSVTIDENPAVNLALGTVDASTNRGELLFTLSDESPAGALSIVSTTGELTVGDASLFDFETNPTITATVAASVEDVVETAQVTITLNNVVEDILLEPLSFTIDENPANGLVLGTATATTDGGGTVVYSIANDTEDDAIGIDAASGELTVSDSTVFNFEVNPEVRATVTATVEGISTSAALLVVLNDVSEMITVQPFSISTAENATTGQVLGTLSATTASGSITYSIPAGSTNSAAFGVDSQTGEISVADGSLYDFENATNGTLTGLFEATNGDDTEQGSITIDLINVIELLTPEDFSTTISENPQVNAVLGTVNVNSDADSLAFELITDNLSQGETPAAFSINGFTGELSVADSSIFDFETRNAVTSRFRVTGFGEDRSDQRNEEGSITINLIDVSETFIALDFTTTIDENPTSGQSLGTVSVDTDLTNINYSIVTNNLQAGETPAAFSIDASGRLTVADAGLYDFETRQTVTARYTATDADGSLQDEGSITITLNDLAEFDPDALVLTYEMVSDDLLIQYAADPSLTYNFDIDWGDGTRDENVTYTGSTLLVDHTYSAPGIYDVVITGDFPG